MHRVPKCATQNALIRLMKGVALHLQFPRPIFVGADLASAPLAEALTSKGFDPSKPALFTCEGILCYLPQVTGPIQHDLYLTTACQRQFIMPHLAQGLLESHSESTEECLCRHSCQPFEGLWKPSQ